MVSTPRWSLRRCRSSQRALGISHASATTKWSIHLPIIKTDKKKMFDTDANDNATQFFFFPFGRVLTRLSLNSVRVRHEHRENENEKKKCCELLQWLYLQMNGKRTKRYKTKQQRKWPMPKGNPNQTQIISVCAFLSIRFILSFRFELRKKKMFFFVSLLRVLSIENKRLNVSYRLSIWLRAQAHSLLYRINRLRSTALHADRWPYGSPSRVCACVSWNEWP